jgi:hypothetical protein
LLEDLGVGKLAINRYFTQNRRAGILSGISDYWSCESTRWYLAEELRHRFGAKISSRWKMPSSPDAEIVSE